MRQNLLLAALILCGAPAVWADLPHRDYTTQTKTATVASGGSTDTVLWTPASGKSIVLQGCLLSAETAGTVEIESSNVDVIPPVHLETIGTIAIGFGPGPLWMGTANATLTYTTTDGAFSILCVGYEAQR